MEVFGFDLGPIVPFILIGFAAQMVDGALGMAFGVITNTLMVGLLGVPPALASQRVHLVECFTTATSGISHLLHGNIDKGLFFRLLVPGVIGGLLGTYLITSIDGDTIKPFVLIYLAGIGVWLLIRGLLYPPKLRLSSGHLAYRGRDAGPDHRGDHCRALRRYGGQAFQPQADAGPCRHRAERDQRLRHLDGVGVGL